MSSTVTYSTATADIAIEANGTPRYNIGAFLSRWEEIAPFRANSTRVQNNYGGSARHIVTICISGATASAMDTVKKAWIALTLTDPATLTISHDGGSLTRPNCILVDIKPSSTHALVNLAGSSKTYVQFVDLEFLQLSA